MLVYSQGLEDFDKRGNQMRRINWFFAAIMLVALGTTLNHLVLMQYYEAPDLVRHHLADFGFASLFTLLVSSLVCVLARALSPIGHWLRRSHHGDSHTGTGGKQLHQAIPVAGAILGLCVGLMQLFNLGSLSSTPVGRAISEWFNPSGADAFGATDLAWIAAGGVAALLLQVASTKRIRRWQLTPLTLNPSP